MANRFWVGDSGLTSDTAHWSTSSGGTGGASVPSSTDDIFIDTNSGLTNGSYLDFNGNLNCHDFLSTTGISYILGHTFSGALKIYGSATFEFGLSTHAGLTTIIFAATTTSNIVQWNGFTPNVSVGFQGTLTAAWTLLDDMNVTSNINFMGGIFDANNKNITITGQFYFYADTGFSPEVYMGSGTWTSSDIDPFWFDNYSGQFVIVHQDTANIRLTNTTNSDMHFTNYIDEGAIQAIPLYDVEFLRGNSTGKIYIDGEFSYYSFQDLGISAHQLLFAAGSIQTTSHFFVSPNIDIESSSSGVPWNISCPTGKVILSGVSLKDSHAGGGAFFFAGSYSSNLGGNTGWLFQTSPFPSFYQ